MDRSTEVAKLVQSAWIHPLKIEDNYLSQIYIPAHENLDSISS